MKRSGRCAISEIDYWGICSDENNKPGEIQVHQSSQSKQTSASKISHDWICITCEVCSGFILYTLGYFNGTMKLMNSNWTFVRHL